MRFCRIFFFKQTTAYEWRISDWSSDVCSSDLVAEVDRSSHRALPDDRLRHGAEAVELVMVSNGEVLPAPGRGAISMTSPSVAEPERSTAARGLPRRRGRSPLSRDSSPRQCPWPERLVGSLAPSAPASQQPSAPARANLHCRFVVRAPARAH